MTKTTSPSILITGATGSVGSELVKILSAKGVSFRAMVRSLDNTSALASLPGAELVMGDLQDKESIRQAMKGIERAFLLTNSSEQAETLQSNFVEAAVSAGVKHIVKLSQYATDINSPVRFLRYHAAIEQQIRASGIAYTFLRPNLYMQGFLGFRDSIALQGKFFAAAGDAKISVVDVRDIAAVAAEALTGSKHENEIYDITGPETLSHQEIAECFSSALGHAVKFIDVSAQDMRNAVLQVGFPEWQADGLIEDYAHYARGEAAAISSAVEDVTRQEPRSFARFVSDYANAFSTK